MKKAKKQLLSDKMRNLEGALHVKKKVKEKQLSNKDAKKKKKLSKVVRKKSEEANEECAQNVVEKVSDKSSQSLPLLASGENREEDEKFLGEFGSGSSDSEDEDLTAHANFLDSIRSLDKAKQSSERWDPAMATSSQRKAVSTETEHELTASMGELLDALKGEPDYEQWKKAVQPLRNKKYLLPEPLEKHKATKVRRSAMYDKARKEISRWDPVVEANRNAEHLSFPLDEEKISLHEPKEFLTKVKPRTPLEKEIAALLYGEDAEEQAKASSQQEKAETRARRLQLARQRLSDVQKLRVIISYKAAKARRQNKIKSKKYHRLLKRSRLQQKEKELEELKKTNPEKADEQFERFEKQRIKERATFKHKNAGKWAKKMLQHGKYDDNARAAMQEQIQTGRKLLEKQIIHSDSDDNDDESENPADFISFSKESGKNPWMKSANAFLDRKKEEEEAKFKPFVPNDEADSEEHETEDEREGSPEGGLKQGLKRKSTLKDLDDSSDDGEEESVATTKRRVTVHEKRQNEEKQLEIDPNAFMKVESKMLKSNVPGLILEEEDYEKDRTLTIAEAFADDDVVDEFRQEKKETVEKDRPKDIDLTLPGWGRWGGGGIQPSARKRKRFRVKAPTGPPRKDAGLRNVIMSETVDNKIREHQVKELPFPFKKTSQFESSIRTPIGKTWNTETAFEKLTEPAVKTKMGTIIPPLDANEVFTEERRRKPAAKDGKTAKKGKRRRTAK